jgi:tetratricopeptide (TPR) repeat protein
MSARAKIGIPDSNATEEQLLLKGLEAIEELIRRDKIIFFDDADLVTEDDYSFKEYFKSILKLIPKLGDIPPILIASTNYPKLDFELDEISHTIKVNPLEDRHILSILEKLIKSLNPEGEIPCRENLCSVARQLYGYPLAARLAANVITKYSVELTLDDLSHFKSIRLDIAKQLLGRSKKKMSETQKVILQILTLADTGLTQYDISKLLDIDHDTIRESLNEMFLDQIIYLERSRIQILPLMKDYYWESINQSRSLNELSNRIAIHCKLQLSACEQNSEEFLNYCSISYRLFIMADNELEARQLAYYFKGELKEAAKNLYYAKDYALSMKYFDMLLSVDQKDYYAKWFKARCLSHIEKYEEAERILKELEKSNFSPFKLYHTWGLLYRRKNQMEKAIYYFKKGLDYRPDNLPLLRDYGDVLEKTGNLEQAYKELKLAYDIAPRDPSIAEKYADILEKKGLIDEAIDILIGLTKSFPDRARSQHRLSMLNYANGNFEEAYSCASIAYSLDPTLYEAVTHLAALDVDRGNIELAEKGLESLPTQLTHNQKRVRDTIFAKMLFKEGKMDEARKKLMNYDFTEDPYCASILANIECKEAGVFFGKSQISIANDRLKKGFNIIINTLEKFPKNKILENDFDNLASLDHIFNNRDSRLNYETFVKSSLLID